MTSQLRRIIPRSRRPQAATPAPALESKNGQTLRVDSAEPPVSKRAETNRRIARLKQIGGALQELIHLSETNRRLPRTTHGYAPARSAIQLETRKLLNQISGLLGDSSNSDNTAKVVSAKRQASNHRRKAEAIQDDRRLVKMKISARTIRVLEAFRKAGHDPSRLVESSLWKNAEVRDAAEILGMIQSHTQ